ncbi:MAG: hypothetical protein H8F28_26860 [Fibrella sp.]|nr:hypothetical protein [Armatimonadota bacterium]
MEPAIEHTPPPPVLGDFVRDQARKQERHLARKWFFPIRFGKPRPADPAPTLGPQNPWRVIVETIPVDATTLRPIQPLRSVRGVVTAGRSRFRKGTLTLDEDGFTLLGTGVTPVVWLGKLGCLGYVVWISLLFTVAWVQGNPVAENVMRGVGLISFCVGVLGFALENVITEARRGPQEIRVFWDNVMEAQFEPNMRWAVILYRAPEPKPGVPGPVAQLPLNNLTPAVAGALWDAFDAYAPGRTRPDCGVYQWTTTRKILALLLLGTIAGSAMLLLNYTINH